MKSRSISALCVGLAVITGLAALAEEPAAVAAPAVTVPAAPAETTGTPIEITTIDLSPVYPWAEAEFDKQYPPELDAEKAKVEWKKNVKLVNGTCDLIGELGQKDNIAVYARVILDAADVCKVHLSMGSDDGLTVVVNGTKIFGNNIMRALTPDQDQADIELAKGRNEVLLRVTQGNGAMGLHVAAKVLSATKVVQVPGDETPAVSVPATPEPAAK